MNSYKRTNSILIIFGLIFISYFIFVSFKSYQKEKTEKELIEVYFANIDAFEILDTYEQIDSVSPNVITYSKLKNFNEKDTYFNKNIDNSNSVTTYSKLGIKNKKNNNNARAKATTYSKLGKSSKNPYFSKNIDNSSSVKTYTQLNSYKKEKKKELKQKKEPKKTSIKPSITKQKSNKQKENFTSNVTSYTKIKKTKKIKKRKEKKYNNVTSYSKLKKEKKKKTQKFSSNVTTYTKLKKKKERNNTTNYSKPKTVKKPLTYNAKKNVLVYHNKALNKAENINKIDSSPIYPGCENKNSERDKKSCLLTSVSKFSINNFNTSIAKEANLSKGIYETRVLFVIDKNGYSKAYKVLGNWHPKIKNELKRIIRQLPKMKPGKTENQNIDVKYSIKLPFIVK